MTTTRVWPLLALVSALSALPSHAEEAEAHVLSYNLGATTDYRFRGMSKSNRSASVSAGLNYSYQPLGLYLGTSATKITWIKDTPGAGNTPVDWNLYGGKTGRFDNDVTYDVGMSALIFLNSNMPTNANTLEAFGKLGYGPAYVRYSRSLTNFLASSNSRGSGYVMGGANFSLTDNLYMDAHVGRQLVKNHANENYTDWGVSLSRDFGFAFVSLSAVGTFIVDKSAYTNAGGKFLGPTSLILSVSKSF